MRKIISLLVAMFAVSLCYAEPSVHDIYEAAKNGNYLRADALMKEVLNAHPESAKAHFVHAELLAKENKLSYAQEELNRAKELDPSLKFASATAVDELTMKLSSMSQRSNQSSNNSGNSGSSLTIFFLIIGAAAIVLFFVLRRRNTVQVYPAAGMPSSGVYPGAPVQGGPMGSGYYPPQANGGSGLMGSLATGAAIGAGMVAGEALAHRLMDGNGREIQPGNSGGFQGDNNGGNYDMGGNDFGVSGNDWDNTGGSDFGGDSGGGDW